MIYHIKGSIVDTFANGVIIENNGIGYELTVPGSSALFLASPGKVVTAYTAMIVKEDDVSLYGFDDKESRRIFYMLTSVSGIGAKAGISILSALSVEEIKKAVIFNDPDMLARAQGVGKKTAQRVVLELKDKFKNETFADSSEQNAGRTGADGSLTNISEAIDALIALGYSKAEASEAVSAVKQEDGSAEDYIKAALKNLSNM